MAETLELYRQGVNGLDIAEERQIRRRRNPMTSAVPPLRPGQHIQLNTPDNPKLHGALANIVECTEWGAHVTTSAAASGQFRALYSEIIILTEVAVHPTKHGKSVKQAKDEGYTGDCCAYCGGFKMKRNGNCAVCCDCGESGGCS